MRIIAIAAAILFMIPGNAPAAEPIRGIYIGQNAIGVLTKVETATALLRDKEINTIVVDKNDDFGREVHGKPFTELIKPFRTSGAYIICRIVVFKFRNLSTATGEGIRRAIVRSKQKPNEYWRNHAGDYFFDPSSKNVLFRTIEISLRAIDDDCDELNFDYIRYPSDGELKDIAYPSGEETRSRKREIMWEFISQLGLEIRAYDGLIPVSADLFGYAAMGRDPGVGQFPEDFIRAGFKVYGMFYPSLYICKSFGLPNPNTNPYATVRKSVEEKLGYLKHYGLINGAFKGIFTAWIQGNDSKSYQCKADPNPMILYYNDRDVLRLQIRAIEDTLKSADFKALGLKPSWIVWHSSGIYNPKSYLPKNPKEH